VRFLGRSGWCKMESWKKQVVQNAIMEKIESWVEHLWTTYMNMI
jgi:hypothetical protein